MFWFLCVLCTFSSIPGQRQSATYVDPTPEHNQAERQKPLLYERKKDFNPKSFTIIPSVTVDDTWGFADKNVLPLDHRPFSDGEGSHEWMEKNCKTQLETQWIPAHKNGDQATLIYYPDQPHYKNFTGWDLIPENKEHYHDPHPYKSSLYFDRKEEIIPGEEVVIRNCILPTPRDGGAWHVQKMGPFISTGGYDWWQFAWSDLANLSEVYKKHPEGVDVDVSSMIPVTEAGARLGYPPIHVHHIHAIEQPGARPRVKAGPVCTKEKFMGIKQFDVHKYCYNASLFLEQHGDYQCTPEDDGIDCLVAGSNNLRRFRVPLDIEGDLNDIRPAGSPKLRWYIQVAVHWKPIDYSTPAVSQMTLMAPLVADLYKDQSTRFGIFPTPTAYESFIWYSGPMWASGTLVRNKLHAHTAAFTLALWFVGTASDLGLDKEGFIGEKAYHCVRTQSLGFENNVALMEYFWANLKKSQDRWDAECGSREACGYPRPHFLCAAKHDSGEFAFEGLRGPENKLGSHYQFDRRPLTHCKPWKFEKGEYFTTVGLFPKIEWPVLPATSKDTVPEFYPGHISWHLWYNHDGWLHSYFGRVVYSQTGPFFDAHYQFGWADIVGLAACLAWYQDGGVAKSQVPYETAMYTARYIFKIMPLFACLFLYFCGRKVRRFMKHRLTPTD